MDARFIAMKPDDAKGSHNSPDLLFHIMFYMKLSDIS